MGNPDVEPLTPSDRALVAQFHNLYYGRHLADSEAHRWLGITCLKCPLDLWIYQDVLFECRPELIIECGTYKGGSALYLAAVLDQLQGGKILSIDCNDDRALTLPKHPRVEYLHALSTEPETLIMVRQRIQREGSSVRVMAILDSDHSKGHVLREIQAYAPLVTSGQYLIVEDTAINGHPVSPEAGPGPFEAVEEFLSSDEGQGFVVDRSRERLLLTYNPGGYLRKL